MSDDRNASTYRKACEYTCIYVHTYIYIYMHLYLNMSNTLCIRKGTDLCKFLGITIYIV